ncbi:MAG: hypothetical protein EHM21_15290 [Chloroflexi bacterium]|nr:MAG: hypothetical protein EHM21_15290 [Chloroflexota bacterium]
MTRYIAAYDTEMLGDCLRACRKIRAVHERFEIPATFFIVGAMLEKEGPAYRSVLGDCELFEIASHTYSHQMLRDHPFCGPAPAQAERQREIRLGKQRVEETFGRPCVGLRPGCGFANGLRGDTWLQDEIHAAGFGYVSSRLWGPEYSLPALLEAPYSYAAEGSPELWEMPGHGWHENVLKAHNLTTSIQRLLAWPMPDPDLVPPGPLRSAGEEFELNRRFIDKAVKMDLPYISLVWHPWSLAKFDPPMRMLELTFQYVRDRGLEPTTYQAEWERMKNG